MEIQNYNSISNISQLYIEIKILNKKISTLENENIHINEMLNTEISHRKNYEESISFNLSKFHQEIMDDVNQTNTIFLQSLQQINNNKYKNLKPEIISNIGDELYKENNINFNNYSFDSVKTTPLKQNKNLNENQKQKQSFEDIVKSEFEQYRHELNKNTLKIESLEKMLNDLLNEKDSNKNNMDTNFEKLSELQKNFENFKKQTVNNFISFKNDFNSNIENNKNYLEQIDDIINNFDKKIKNFENSFQNDFQEFSNNKQKYEKIINDFSFNINNEIKNIHTSFNNQLNEHGNEIDKFEKYILEEHEKFITFVQNHVDESINSIKGLFDLNGDDINKLNLKIEIIQDLIKKLRIDVFQNISDSQEFMQNKIDSILRMIGKE